MARAAVGWIKIALGGPFAECRELVCHCPVGKDDKCGAEALPGPQYVPGLCLLLNFTALCASLVLLYLLHSRLDGQ